MSTQVQIHVRSDGMHDDMLRSEGVLGVGVVGLLDQLTSDEDYMDEFTELLSESPNYIVGTSPNPFPDAVSDSIAGVETVDEGMIDTFQRLVSEYNVESDDLIEWLKDNEGEEVFVIHW